MAEGKEVRWIPKREKTKHKGIYRVGETYYITYCADGKKHEEAAGDTLGQAVREKAKHEDKGKNGKYAVHRRMEKPTFRELMKLYREMGDNKSCILRFEKQYLDYLGGRKLASISRSDLFDFRDVCKKTPKQVGGGEVTDTRQER
jgi:hypothetical protein